MTPIIKPMAKPDINSPPNISKVNKTSKVVIENADYSNLDALLISIIVITIMVPISAIVLIQSSRYKSKD